MIQMLAALTVLPIAADLAKTVLGAGTQLAQAAIQQSPASILFGGEEEGKEGVEF